MRNPPAPGEGDESSPFLFQVERERRRLVAEAKRTLPNRYQTLLEWRYGEGFTFAEIGQRWGVSRVAVHHMHTRAMDLLRRYLRSRGIHDFRHF